jgi:hypothetical protein
VYRFATKLGLERLQMWAIEHIIARHNSGLPW